MAVQLIKPNPKIACQPNLCLVYVRETFGLAAKYPSAIAGWQASKYKHHGYDFPDDAAVPLWFSLSDNEFGHVVLRQPDGTIWSASHPTNTKPVHHKNLQDLESYYKGRLQYLGWTEDIEGKRVARLTEADKRSAINDPNAPREPAEAVKTPPELPIEGDGGVPGLPADHPVFEHMRINQKIDAELKRKRLKNSSGIRNP